MVDDYGHHPTEIRATLAAAREYCQGRIHVIFQPHRYTRTRDLLDEFGGAFGDADSVTRAADLRRQRRAIARHYGGIADLEDHIASGALCAGLCRCDRRRSRTRLARAT